MVAAGKERGTREGSFSDRLTGIARGSLFALAVFISSTAVCNEASGTSVAREFAEFKRVCSVVALRAESKFQSSLNWEAINKSVAWEAINKSVAASLESRLSEKGLSFPVAYGNQCYPGSLPRSPKTLGLLFYVTVAESPAPQSVAIAILVHSFSQGTQISLHDHPTAIKFCKSDDLSRCLMDHLAGYADDTVVKTIERVQSLMKGDR